MARALEEEIKVDVKGGEGFTEVLVSLLAESSGSRHEALSACTSCAGCNNGGPTCVSCVCVSTGRIEYGKSEQTYGASNNGYAQNNL